MKFVLEELLHTNVKNELQTKKFAFKEYKKRKNCIFLLECNGSTFQEFERVVGDEGGYAIYSQPQYGYNVPAWPAPFLGERNNIFILMEPQDRDLLFEKDIFYPFLVNIMGRPLYFTKKELDLIDQLRMITSCVFSPKLESMTNVKALKAALVKKSMTFLLSDLSYVVSYVRNICVRLSSLKTYKTLCSVIAETFTANIITGPRDKKNYGLTVSGETVLDFYTLTQFENKAISLLFALLRGVWDVSSAILLNKYGGDRKTAVLSVARSHGRMVKKLVQTIAQMEKR